MPEHFQNSRLAVESSAGILLTVKDIAVLDRCSEKTVHRAIETGRLQKLELAANLLADIPLHKIKRLRDLSANRRYAIIPPCPRTWGRLS